MVRKLPSAFGRITSRSYSGRYARICGPLPMNTLKWLSQKSVITSCNCRSDNTARATRAACISPTSSRVPACIARTFALSAALGGMSFPFRRCCCAITCAGGGYLLIRSAELPLIATNRSPNCSARASSIRVGSNCIAIHLSTPIARTFSTSPGRGPKASRLST